MKKMNLKLENCHGISSLNYLFDFSERDYIIYATNGTMKTSLYNTIYEYKDGQETKDNFFPKRISTRIIEDENNLSIKPESIIAIGNDDYDVSNDKVTALLINNDLKKKYDSLVSTLDKQYKQIAKIIKSISGETIETMLCDFNVQSIYELPQNLFDNNEVNDKFEEVKYKSFFTKDNLEILKDKDVVDSVNEYINICNKIVSENTIFAKDIFELYNLKAIKKSLDSNNYFETGHLLKFLTDKEKNKYTDYNQLQTEELIRSIEETIESDERINKVNQTLTGKIKAQDLNIFLSQNKWIIPLLNNIDQLKKDYWNYVIFSNPELVTMMRGYIYTYKENESGIKEIIALSKSEENFKKWNEAVDIFNNRFINMPFKLKVSNISDIILKASTCSLIYEFHDAKETNPDVSIDLLKNNLSKGERKAFNILNLIFEIQYRKEKNIETIILIDDIADSFDYKNKYAIVELLKELNNNNLFHLIILTHNFDFYRICANSLNVNTLSILKDDNINFINFHYCKNIFTTFKQNLNKELYFIASIPFVRNIIELSSDTNNPMYIKLTSALHYKRDTVNMMIKDINDVFLASINRNSNIQNGKYLDLLFLMADSITKSTTAISLENKLVLSIAIRMQFESKLFSKFNDWDVIDNMTKNQTNELIKYCIDNKLMTTNDLNIAEKVKIMTSENIHVNSFMYEPIIDMSDDELISLYQEVKKM